MSVKMRREVEEKIVGQFVRDALAAGYKIAVSLDRGYDVDEMTVLGSTDYDAIMKEAFAGDDCHIFVQDANKPPVFTGNADVRERLLGGAGPTIKRVASIGWVNCIFGNDGWDVISDYSANAKIEALLVEANKISDHYSEL